MPIQTLCRRAFPVLFLLLFVLPVYGQFGPLSNDEVDDDKLKWEFGLLEDLGPSDFGGWGFRGAAPFDRLILPSRLSDEEKKKLFGNMPDEFREPVTEKLLAIESALDDFLDGRKNLYLLLQPHFRTEYYRDKNFESHRQYQVKWEWTTLYFDLHRAFTRYPNVYHPDEREQYWRESAGDLLEILDRYIVCIEKDRKREAEEWNRLKDLSSGELTEARREPQRDGYAFDRHRDWRNAVLTDLPETKRKRFAEGKPAYRNPFLDCGARVPEKEPDENTLDASAEEESDWDWNDTWPELEALGLTAEDVHRWDGSTSLEGVAQLLVAKICGAYLEMEHWSPAADFEKAPKEFSFRLAPRSDSSGETLEEYVAAQKKLDENPIYLALARRNFSKTHEAIVNVIGGHRDLAFSTRMPSPDELALAEEKGVELLCTPFAQDAFVFVVNRYNFIDDLTTRQIRDIFSGKIKDWRDLGGFGKIVALTRNRNSGSEELMREIVMAGRPVREDTHSMVIMTMQGVFNQLDVCSTAVGYTVWYYERYVAEGDMARVIGVDGVKPTRESIASGEYPFSYKTVLIRRKPKAGEGEKIEAFVRWMRGAEGRRFVRASQYVPLAENEE